MAIVNIVVNISILCYLTLTFHYISTADFVPFNMYFTAVLTSYFTSRTNSIGDRFLHCCVVCGDDPAQLYAICGLQVFTKIISIGN